MQCSCTFSEEKIIVSVNSTPCKAGMAIHLVDDERNKWYTPWEMTLPVKVMRMKNQFWVSTLRLVDDEWNKWSQIIFL